MRRSGAIRKVSSKQAKKNRTWSALKLARIKASINCVGSISCEGCPVTFYDVERAQEGLQGHHRVQRSLCGEYTDENMALFCHVCHQLVHSSSGLRAARLSSSL